MSRPGWRDVRRFCERQGYAQSGKGHHHFDKPIPDLRMASGTMISKGVDDEVIDPIRWQIVWKQQLHLASEDEFWKGLRGEPVRYAVPPKEEVVPPLPLYLQRFLRETLMWDEPTIASTSRDAAQEELNNYYSREQDVDEDH